MCYKASRQCLCAALVLLVLWFQVYSLPLAQAQTPITATATTPTGLSAVASPVAPELSLQGGHTSWVTSIAFSPDSKTLASGSWDHTIKLWDTATGELKRTLSGHQDYVRAVAFSPDGNTLVSGSSDESLKLWDTHTGALKRSLRYKRVPARTLDAPGGAVSAVAFSPDGKVIASGSDDMMIKLWDAESGELKRLLHGHSARVLSLAFTPDGQTLASGSSDKTVCLWSLPAALQGATEPQKTLPGAVGRVSCVAFAPDGKTLAGASSDSTIKLWEIPSGALQKTLQGHKGDVNSLAFAPDGQHLVSTSNDMTVRLWNVHTGESAQTLNQTGYLGDIFCVAYSPDGRWIATANQYRSIQLWDAHSGAPVQMLSRPHRMFAVAFAPDGKTLVGGCTDRTIKVWNLATGGLEKSLVGHTDEVHALLFTPHGEWLLSAGDDAAVRVWDMEGPAPERGELLQTLAQPQQFVRGLALAPDGKTLAIGSASTEGVTAKREIQFWSLAGRKSWPSLAATNGAVTALAFAPHCFTPPPPAVNGGVDGGAPGDCQSLAVASADALELWQVNSGPGSKPILQRTLPVAGRLMHSVAISPDGKLLASGSGDRNVGEVALRHAGEVRLWNAETGKLLRTLQGHEDIVTALAFSPDGHTLASGSGDFTVNLWDATGELQATLAGHAGLVTNVAFSPDGRLLASASDDGTIKVWNTHSGELIITSALLRPTHIAPQEQDSTAWIAYTPAGYYTGSTDVDKYIQWQVGTEVYPAAKFQKTFYRPDLIAVAVQKALQ